MRAMVLVKTFFEDVFERLKRVSFVFSDERDEREGVLFSVEESLTKVWENEEDEKWNELL